MWSRTALRSRLQPSSVPVHRKTRLPNKFSCSPQALCITETQPLEPDPIRISICPPAIVSLSSLLPPWILSWAWQMLRSKRGKVHWKRSGEPSIVWIHAIASRDSLAEPRFKGLMLNWISYHTSIIGFSWCNEALPGSLISGVCNTQQKQPIPRYSSDGRLYQKEEAAALNATASRLVAGRCCGCGYVL